MSVSVILAVHNGEAYVERCLKSISAQTFNNFEVIIVDDASTDNSKALIEKFKTSLPELTFIENHENLGLTKSLNLGLKAARRRYIARIDHDDAWPPDHLEAAVAFFDADPTMHLVGHNPYNPKDADVVQFKDIMCRNVFVHSSVLFKRLLLDSPIFYDENLRYSQDHELWLRILKHGNGIASASLEISETKDGANISVTRRRAQIACSLRARFKHFSLSKISFLQIYFFLKDLIRLLVPAPDKTRNLSLQ